jgi:hypothetical protein
MAGDSSSTDWTDLRVQSHWYKLRHEFDGAIRSATGDIRSQYDVLVKLSSSTITTDGDRLVLRVPVAANWNQQTEQTIAVILVSSTHEDEPRIAAIAHGISALLERWIQREVPVGASPSFLYPENEVRWPDMPESHGGTAEAVNDAAASQS